MNAPKLFLCGDVVTARGIDQIMAYPCEPTLYESYVRDALEYVRLAERVNGLIPRAVDSDYVWGEAIAELERFQPDARIINLETAVTRSAEWMPKGINYRMSPENIGCIAAARIDCCVLANNHVLDWGEQGLIDTLATLESAGVRSTGAGRNRAEAEAPAVLEIGDAGRVLVYARGAASSGIPPGWAATEHAAGVAFLPDLALRRVDPIARQIEHAKRPGDLVVLSIHWGGNWSYAVSEEERRFAHALIESAGVDLIHGHSSHHPKGIEIHRGKLIIWGCGDFINDYEGISGHEYFRGDLSLMYFPTLDAATGQLERLELVPTQMNRFRVRRATDADAAWLCAVLQRESASFSVRFKLRANGRIDVAWRAH